VHGHPPWSDSHHPRDRDDRRAWPPAIHRPDHEPYPRYRAL